MDIKTNCGYGKIIGIELSITFFFSVFFQTGNKQTSIKKHLTIKDENFIFRLFITIYIIRYQIIKSLIKLLITCYLK